MLWVSSTHLIRRLAALQAQSFALQNISGNIANASTIGYKGIDTSFEDLDPRRRPVQQAGRRRRDGFIAQQTITTQGTVTDSTVATNMAINGDGFFSVQKPTGDHRQRAGVRRRHRLHAPRRFQVNANGNLVNGAGYYLMGVTVDPKTGNPTGNVPAVLQFQNNFIPAQATTAINMLRTCRRRRRRRQAPSAAAGTITADGGINPADFASASIPWQSARRRRRSPTHHHRFRGQQRSTAGARPITASTNVRYRRLHVQRPRRPRSRTARP